MLQPTESFVTNCRILFETSKCTLLVGVDVFGVATEKVLYLLLGPQLTPELFWTSFFGDLLFSKREFRGLYRSVGLSTIEKTETPDGLCVSPVKPASVNKLYESH